MDTSKASISVQTTLARLRKGYAEGANRSYESRIQNLQALKNSIKKNESRIEEALQKDLFRSSFLTKLTETDVMIDLIDYYISNLSKYMAEVPKDLPAFLAPGKIYLKPEPYGVALVIGSWNFPFATSLKVVVVAIAAGNCVCVKPSEMSAYSSAVIREITESLDQRVFGCVEGGPEAAIALLNERWDLIVFTGSPDKGKLIASAAAKYLTPTILELGGKNPCIIDQDAKMDVSLKRIVQGRFLNAGQLCISPDMVLIHSSRVEEFTEAIKKTITDFFGSDPKKSEDFGRIINDMHTKRIGNLLDGHKGQTICGGLVDPQEKYVAPTVILNPDVNSPVGTQEIFGPILVVFTYNNFEECIDLINSREKPLALYYFGGNKKNMESLKNRTSSGNITWNDCVFHAACDDLAFGGVGNSGNAKIFGKEGFMAMSHMKSVMEKSTLNIDSCRYPPHTLSNQKTFFRLKSFLGFPLSRVNQVAKYVVILGVVYVLVSRGYLQTVQEGLVSFASSARAYFRPKI